MPCHIIWVIGFESGPKKIDLILGLKVVQYNIDGTFYKCASFVQIF